MTVIMGSFSACDRTRDPDEQFAEIRQKVVDSLHQTIDNAKHGWLFPTFLIEAVENEVWMHPRKLTHNMIPPMPLAEFIKRSYPTGLGVNFEIVEKLIAGNERAMLAWDKAVRGEHGGNRNPTGRNQHTPEPESGAVEVKPDNILLDLAPASKPSSDYGTSAQAGLRRLEKAASDGDGNAADLLRRVIDPDDAMTVNGACVAMGWRKPTLTVVNTPDGLVAASARVMDPLDNLRRLWSRANQQEREEMAAWMHQQMSPLAQGSLL